jgi:hypothetical protein
MNRLSLLLVALGSVLTAPAVEAQIHTGNLSLNSQAEVNAFAFSEVTGSLTISGSDIVDLSPLSPLTRVGTYLSISDNTALTHVDGFQNLTEVGRGIYVWENTSLVSFSGFDALLHTGDNIDFWFNDSLVTVSGFDSLQSVGWSLEFGENAALTSIPRFKSLETINSSLFVLSNASLTGITGFSALRHVDWSMDILSNATLATLCGFYDYFSANGSFTGGGSFVIADNDPSLPSPTTIQDILDAGPCEIQLLDSLISEIQEMGLPPGTQNFLVNALEKAKNSVESGRQSDATKKLAALIDDIRSLEQRGRLDGATADYLVAAVSEIIDAINA